MSYKKRLLNEYADLKAKTIKLDNYLYENDNRTKTSKEISNFHLMRKQLETMNSYLAILEERLLLEMGEEPEVVVSVKGLETAITTDVLKETELKITNRNMIV